MYTAVTEILHMLNFDENLKKIMIINQQQKLLFQLLQ